MHFDSTENLFIEGDNLDALKLLQETYLGKVKMIYIDPPYNTGKDFVYADDFAENTEDYLRRSNQKDEDGNRMEVNSESNGRFHSDWLSMMYPRLKLARNLLTDDGVIFISIDDNEQANLKRLCDEVFGQKNFVGEFPRVTKKGGKSSTSIAKNHDYIFAYAKQMDLIGLVGVKHNDEGYSLKDEHFETRGYYKLNQTLDYDSLGYVSSLDYPIIIDEEEFYAGGSKEEYQQRQKGQHGRADWAWRWSKDLYLFGYENDFIVVRKGGQRPRIYTKTYQNVKIERDGNGYKIVEIDRTKPLSTLEFTENIYSNDNAKKKFDELMQQTVFEYTKPVSLIYRLMELIPDKKFLILDFFAGSGTTAHAVMQFNAEDGGNRRFICVQLPEKTDEKSEAFKAGFATIAEITKERIRRAADKIRSDFADKLPENWDGGFRVLKTDTSNMADVYYTPEETLKKMQQSQQDWLNQVSDNIKPDRTPEDLLFQVMLDWGVDLALPIEVKQIMGRTVFFVDGNTLIACFDKQAVDNDFITALTQYQPLCVVFRDDSFKDDAAKINTSQIFQQYSESTEVKTI